ncbi:hypothetical protein PIB30_040706 [Stylosanthes scabra]|uniref:Uncharacterized protein n=1 Tax=Stylosanthes scabra TaxID=79078 RepID=A0ABU6SEL7_9FABA|nr:hypothetical protein [Stylosanthes scabra]
MSSCPMICTILGTFSIHSSEINSISGHIPFLGPSVIPDHPYEYPISEMRPDGGIRHPSPPPAPYYSPPHGPDFHQGYNPDHPEIPLIPPLAYDPPGQAGYDYAPYDLPVELAPVRVEPPSPHRLQLITGLWASPMIRSKILRDSWQEMDDTDSDDEDPSEDEEPSSSSGGKSVVSVDTRESHV